MPDGKYFINIVFLLLVMSLCVSCLTDEVPEYSLPFVKEVGERPTLEAMRRIVVQKNKRPQIPESWKKHEVILTKWHTSINLTC